MALIDQYKIALQQPDMRHDSIQQQAIKKLQALTLRLEKNAEQRQSVFFNNTFFNRLKKLKLFKRLQPEAVPGLYLWGGVGRGKTWLMNMFYEELAIDKKHRVHFHHFMLDIHNELSSFNTKKQKNPLQKIARDLSAKYQLLCIDEFIVTNITDAMILSELLHALFAHKLILVATSNRVPDDLYLNGLQRERFLPAIELIKNNTEVFQLDSGIDHRTSLLEQRDIYYTPITEKTQELIRLRMQELAITPLIENKIIVVNNRDIETICCSDEVVWFNFDIICSAPRAAQDYIVLALEFNTIFISNIPKMDEYSDDKARRFIYLIDELYDKNVKLIASAADAPEKLYQGNMLEFAFHRTSSRLIEMRSHQYLSSAHKAY